MVGASGRPISISMLFSAEWKSGLSFHLNSVSHHFLRKNCRIPKVNLHFDGQHWSTLKLFAIIIYDSIICILPLVTTSPFIPLNNGCIATWLLLKYRHRTIFGLFRGAILSVPITCVFRLWLSEFDDRRAQRLHRSLAELMEGPHDGDKPAQTWDIMGLCWSMNPTMGHDMPMICHSCSILIFSSFPMIAMVNPCISSMIGVGLETGQGRS